MNCYVQRPAALLVGTFELGSTFQIFGSTFEFYREHFLLPNALKIGIALSRTVVLRLKAVQTGTETPEEAKSPKTKKKTSAREQQVRHLAVVNRSAFRGAEARKRRTGADRRARKRKRRNGVVAVERRDQSS